MTPPPQSAAVGTLPLLIARARCLPPLDALPQRHILLLAFDFAAIADADYFDCFATCCCLYDTPILCCLPMPLYYFRHYAMPCCHAAMLLLIADAFDFSAVITRYSDDYC